MTVIIDSDQHLYESRNLWQEYADPALRDEALSIDDDELGYPWLTWRGRRLDVADVQIPGDTTVLGHHRERLRQGLPPQYDYDEELPDALLGPGRARRATSTSWGSTKRCCSPTTACCGSVGCRSRSPPCRQHGRMEPLVRRWWWPMVVVACTPSPT